MRPIKFRGEIFGGKLVYGDLRHNYHFQNVREFGIEDWTTSLYYRVKPESVAQFVGYDKNGREVYEGDKVWGVGGFVYPSEIFFDTDGSERYQIGDKIPNRLDSTQVE